MSVRADPDPESNQNEELVDLREELRSNLAAQFKTALSSSTALSDNQQTALGELLDSGAVTSAAILSALSAPTE